MASLLRYLFGPLLVVGLLGVATLSLFGDAIAAGSVASGLLFVLDTRFLLGLAVAIFVVSFGLSVYYLRREDPSRLVASGPTVDAFVPVYRDAGVLHRSVEHLVESAYEDLTVTVVCEPDDRASIDRARELAAAHDVVRVLLNHDNPGSKAGALNTALEASDAEVVAMFDADQEPHQKSIAHAVAHLEEADAVRVRSLPRPSGGLLESMAYYESLFLYFLPQKLVRFLLGLRFVGTRSTLVTREVFDRVGAFEEGHLAEDLDFTHEVHQADVAVRELRYYPCFEQPAHTLRDWWGQRLRWMSGQVAVSHAQLRAWRDFPDPDYLGSLVTLVGTAVAGVLLATTVPKLALSALAGPLPVAGGLAAIYGVAVATRYVDDRTTDLEGFGLAWLLMPLTFSLFGLVIVQVLLQYSFGRVGGWYRVEKSAEA